ncbi:MAG: photosynthetic reaction center subunit H [Hyphomicrobium sp.]|nr:photosynthetic reaction center subunit H [Hyphomicrobium sp.]
MKLGQITSYIDVAQVTLYLFWIFFAGLLFYLRREDRREGYPLFSEPSNTYKDQGFLFIPPPKVFILPHGGTVLAPNGKSDDRPIKAAKTAVWPGAPLEPSGDPMLAAVGPGAYAERANIADPMHDGAAKIVPLRVATNYAIDACDGDPRGYTLIGGDRTTAGTISDVWVDRSETMIRYLEANIPGAGSRLIPITFARIDKNRREVKVHALFAKHFANVPALASPNQVTLLEEDKVCAYFGAGTLYAHPSRTEPLL